MDAQLVRITCTYKREKLERIVIASSWRQLGEVKRRLRKSDKKFRPGEDLGSGERGGRDGFKNNKEKMSLV